MAGTARSAEPESPADLAARVVEPLLDRYFSATNDAARATVRDALAQTSFGPRLDDLEQIRTTAARARPHLVRAEVPWRRYEARGWYHLDLPQGYDPRRAWPLVIALHGLPADADNLVPWYQDVLPARGYFVLYPNTIDVCSYWPAPDEQRELLRLIRYLGTCYRLDYRRLCCTGASGGGIGVWHLLVDFPELFAAGLSISGVPTIRDRRLEKLRGLPLYVHHSTRDPIPAALVQDTVALARAYGANQLTLYLAQESGHTPAPEEWERAFTWLTEQPPKAHSARARFFPAPGQLPVGYPRRLPFTRAPGEQIHAEIVQQDHAAAAKLDLPAQLAGTDLLASAIVLAQTVDPDCRVQDVQPELQDLVAAVTRRAGPKADRLALLRALNGVLFADQGYLVDGADPTCEALANQSLPQVVRRRRGNVYALATLYLLVAHQLRLPVYPVVTPYHCFCRYDDGATGINVELTEGGEHFADEVYQQGYGLPKLPTREELRTQGSSRLLAAQLAVLGYIAANADNHAAAARAANAALALDPDCFGALLLVLFSINAQKDYDQALAVLARLRQAWPGYAQVPFCVAEMLVERGETARALAAYQEALGTPLQPYNAGAGFKAEVYLRMARLHAAAYRAARGRGVTDTGAFQRFDLAIRNCLRHNPTHEAARKLLTEMGGKLDLRHDLYPEY